MSDDELFEMEREVTTKPRPRDLAFERLAEVWCGDYHDVTRDQRGRINEALQQIREVSPGLDDGELAFLIGDRARMWEEVYPEALLTPQALTAHWSALPEKARARRNPRATNQAVDVSCQTCGGDRMVFIRYRPSKNGSSPFEEYAPCPDCNAGANVEFWRADGSRFRSLEPGVTRDLMQP